MNFIFLQHQKWSLAEIENMIPWEKEIYVQMLIDHIEEENNKNRTTTTL